MSFEALKEEAARLKADDRRRLMAFLIALEDDLAPGNAARLREKIDDRTTGRWLTVEQMDERLGLNKPGK